MAHARPSRPGPDSGLGVQVHVLKPFEGVPSSLEAAGPRHPDRAIAVIVGRFSGCRFAGLPVLQGFKYVPGTRIITRRVHFTISKL